MAERNSSYNGDHDTRRIELQGASPLSLPQRISGLSLRSANFNRNEESHKFITKKDNVRQSIDHPKLFGGCSLLSSDLDREEVTPVIAIKERHTGEQYEEGGQMASDVASSSFTAEYVDQQLGITAGHDAMDTKESSTQRQLFPHSSTLKAEWDQERLQGIETLVDCSQKKVSGGISRAAGLSSRQMRRVFPFHFVIDHNLSIVQIGEKLQQFAPGLVPGERVDSWFRIVSPSDCAWDLTDLRYFKDATFELELLTADGHVSHSSATEERDTREPTPRCRRLQLSGGIDLGDDEMHPSADANTSESIASSAPGRGSNYDEDRNPTGSPTSQLVMFLVQPDIETLDDMYELNLTWSDFPKHSVIKKLVYMSEHLKSEMDNVQKSRTEAHNAQALLDMKRTFVRYVSHEIRTPLNTVSMGLKLIQHLKPNHAEVDDDAKKRSHDSGSSCVLTDGRQRPDGTVVGRVDENVFDMADEIKESCDIAINILNDLLLYEKMEGGLLALERQREPALSLILEAVQIFAIQAREASLDFDCTYDADVEDYCFRENEIEEPSVFINVDRPKLNQVLRNLVSNAIKFSATYSAVDVATGSAAKQERSATAAPPTKAVTVHASIIDSFDEVNTTHASREKNGSFADDQLPCDRQRVFTPKRVLRVEVQDSGPGISAANQARLFDEIIQFDPNKLQGGQGSGLELFISKGIMDLHGGRIGVSSQGEGCGACFFIEIPIIDESTSSVANKDGLEACASSTTKRCEEKWPKSRSPSRKTLFSEKHPSPTVLTTAPTPRKLAAASHAPCKIVSGFLEGWRGRHGATHNSPAISREPSMEDAASLAAFCLSLANPAAITDLRTISHRRESSTGEILSTNMIAPDPRVIDVQPKKAPFLVETTAAMVDHGNDGELLHAVGLSLDTQTEPIPAAESPSASRMCPHTLSPTLAVTPVDPSGKKGASNVVSLLSSKKASTANGSRKWIVTRTTPASGKNSPRQEIAPQCALPATNQGQVQAVASAPTNPATNQTMEQETPSPDGHTAPGVVSVQVPLPSSVVTTSTSDSRRSPSVAVSEIRAVETTKESSSKQKSSIGHKILVVDDSDSTRKMIVRCLKMKKLCERPVEAGDGAVALKIVRESMMPGSGAPFDAILMDFVMPVMDGPTATKEIRDLGYRGLIIGVTGNVLPEDKAFYISKGADAVLTKPLDIGHLATLLSQQGVDNNGSSSSSSSNLADAKERRLGGRNSASASLPRHRPRRSQGSSHQEAVAASSSSLAASPLRSPSPDAASRSARGSPRLSLAHPTTSSPARANSNDSRQLLAKAAAEALLQRQRAEGGSNGGSPQALNEKLPGGDGVIVFRGKRSRIAPASQQGSQSSTPSFLKPTSRSDSNGGDINAAANNGVAGAEELKTLPLVRSFNSCQGGENSPKLATVGHCHVHDLSVRLKDKLGDFTEKFNPLKAGGDGKAFVGMETYPRYEDQPTYQDSTVNQFGSPALPECKLTKVVHPSMKAPPPFPQPHTNAAAPSSPKRGFLSFIFSSFRKMSGMQSTSAVAPGAVAKSAPNGGAMDPNN